MRRKHGLLIGLILVVVIYPAGRLLAQAVSGSIVGRVIDASGAGVPNAKVTITDIGKDVSHLTATNESGNYSQTHLIVGRYRVRVEASGFKVFIQESVDVSVDSTIRADVALQVGEVTETVTVSSEVPLLKTEKTDVATTFSERSVEELPIFNRNFTTLQLLTPGTQKWQFQHNLSENPQGGTQIMVNGQHFGGTAFQLDGTDNRDPILGIIVINPTLDSVTETKITSQNYDAEFGQALAGVVTAQTKSGTNEVHGSAFMFRRNDLTQARDPFSQSQPIDATGRLLPETLWNQFGGSLGGPIKKNKTFLFGDYQGTRRKTGGSVLTRVPTLAERNGDLSDLGVNIYDPKDANGNEVPPDQRQQFPGNTIPSSRLSAQALNLLQYLPLPNVPGAQGSEPNFNVAGNSIFDDNAFNVRADHYYSNNLHLFGRYSFFQSHFNGPTVFGDIAGGPGIVDAGISDGRNQSIAAGFDYSIRPNLLTDFRFGFFRYRVHLGIGGLGTSPATDAGIPGLNIDDNFSSGMPGFRINGEGAFDFGWSLRFNCNCPLLQEESQFQFVNNWSYIRNNHTFKLGVDIRRARNLRVPSDQRRAGDLTFDPQRAQGPEGGGTGLATFLLGDVSSFGRYVSNSTDAGERQTRTFYYAQDTWRVTPKLTINYGLRWDVYFPETVTGAGKGSLLSLETGEVLVAGRENVSLNMNVQNTLTNWAPRLGIAYQITPKTVIRMGYGLAYDVGVFGSAFGHVATQNLPVLAIQSLSPPNSFESVFTLAEGPSLLNPETVLDTQPKGPNGRRLLPDGITMFVRPFKMRMPSVHAWNATVQHQLTPSISMEAGFVGNKATHTFSGTFSPDYDVNQATIVGFGTLSTNERKPFFQKFGWSQQIRYYGNDTDSNYQSLQAKIEKRFSVGYSVLAHYTWQRSFDHDPDYIAIDSRVGYGPSIWQRNHVFFLTHLWEFPFGKGKRFLGNASKAVDLILGGWQFNGVTTWQGGLPFTPTYRDCGADIDTGFPVCRVDLVGNPAISNPSRDKWFATADAPLETNGATSGPWRRPERGTFGNAGRNSLRGPSFFNADFSFFKNFHVTERVRGQFRAEAFNVFNHVNLALPDNDFQNRACVDCGTAGRIFALAGGASMRQWQFAFRFDF